MIVPHVSLWADERLAEAYDLVDEVVKAHAIPEDGVAEVKALLLEILKADQLLAGILYERRQA